MKRCFRNRFLLVLLILSNITVFTVSQESYQHICIDSRNYTSNSTYKSNLETLLSSLSSNTDENGFYSASVGENPERVYANVLCRGDIKLDLCRSCISNSTSILPKLCPSNKEAIIWYDHCMLRYSSNDIAGIKSTAPSRAMANGNNVTSVDEFNQALTNLLEGLREKAASGDSLRKFATGEAPGPDFQNMYALVQCTPDLSAVECSDCLEGAFRAIPRNFSGKGGARVLRPSCNFRYDLVHFYEDNTDSPSFDTGKKNNTAIIVAIVVVSTISVMILAICILMVFRKRKLMRRQSQRLEVDGISAAESLQFDFGTIKYATNDFSNANKLGEGGFGAVYRGILPNGQEIAVKRLSRNSEQGEAEFKNEVVLVANLQHRNLVRLLGFCLEGTERLLVYEFVVNSSMDNFIFDPIKRAQLDWERRIKIIGGVARGILYLHEDSRLRIIHRDLKASNVLLDAEMNPKIADFGMARLFEMDETQGSTIRIVGTYGYMAPEYAMHGHFSVKSDVFSFGVLILEIVSGQKNTGFRNGEKIEDLLSYAWRSWREGTASDLIDPVLRNGSNSMREMMRCIHIGLLCVQENDTSRPPMASVLLMLSSSSLTLPVPSQPAFFMQSGRGLGMPFEEYSSEVTEFTRSGSKSFVSLKEESSSTELFPL